MFGNQNNVCTFCFKNFKANLFSIAKDLDGVNRQTEKQKTEAMEEEKPNLDAMKDELIDNENDPYQNLEPENLMKQETISKSGKERSGDGRKLQTREYKAIFQVIKFPKVMKRALKETNKKLIARLELYRTIQNHRLTTEQVEQLKEELGYEDDAVLIAFSSYQDNALKAWNDIWKEIKRRSKFNPELAIWMRLNLPRY